ncbi:MAG: hypothetical protein HONDAALG_04451 [Gammaproteobacteria bacterium]|nr:hypothetical protein [Gammaproteobacteria bacterium]
MVVLHDNLPACVIREEGDAIAGALHGRRNDPLEFQAVREGQKTEHQKKRGLGVRGIQAGGQGKP